MSKDAGQRFDDSIDVLQGKFEGLGDEVRASILAWLTLPGNAAIGERLASEISLGSRSLVSLLTSGETERRKLVRAWMLANVALNAAVANGNRPEDWIARQKDSGLLDRLTAKEIERDLRVIYELWVTANQATLAPPALQITYGPSFDLTNSLSRYHGALAVKGAVQLLRACEGALAAVNVSQYARAAFIRWFGTPSAANVAKVKEVYKKIWDSLGGGMSVYLCYRGSDLKRVNKATIERYERANLFSQLSWDDAKNLVQVAFGEEYPEERAKADDCFGYVYPTKKVAGKHTVFLGEDFFNTAVRLGTDSMPGVFIHEMTHVLVGTKDHVYGRRGCKALARGDERRALNNADNYEYFAEEWCKDFYNADDKLKLRHHIPTGLVARRVAQLGG